MEVVRPMRERVLNDEMYLWRADAERWKDDPAWGPTFAARTIWLIDELEHVLTANTPKASS
jgi:hypothetical protein